MTAAEWTVFHCTHCGHHLSFAVEVDGMR
jgi:hypothetical protein